MPPRRQKVSTWLRNMELADDPIEEDGYDEDGARRGRTAPPLMAHRLGGTKKKLPRRQKVSKWLRNMELADDPIDEDGYDDDIPRLGRMAPRPRRLMVHLSMTDELVSNFRDLLAVLRNYTKMLDRVHRLAFDTLLISEQHAEELYEFHRAKIDEMEDFESTVAEELRKTADKVRNGINFLDTFLEEQRASIAQLPPPKTKSKSKSKSESSGSQLF